MSVKYPQELFSDTKQTWKSTVKCAFGVFGVTVFCLQYPI